ncbi:uncharacterized protein Bfra_007361ia [Botrytis fragariae]|uniref:Uncharacterized protein n=1 Tax=Botrytis fragariae TaxID=1964551 RepID=A0A8H6AJ12_9HELO|nr:uncharacterized protein Bfra_007361ia [Botrytis fragariae]KAF5868165.1 hypothetical protein Bfra_007361ia [Botrytis fragariae]
MGTISFKLLVAFLLMAASMTSAHAIPAIDPNVDTPTKAHELVSRAAPDRFPTNSAVATSAEAYTNCCQYKEFDDGRLKFTLNLAGWGNTNHKKNHTISDDMNCAYELISEIMRIDASVETIYDSICVPSYGALRDTFVTFYYSNPDPTTVLLALNSVDPGPELWGCILPKTGNEDSWICKPQQLNI